MPNLGCQLAHVGGIKGVPQGGHLIQHTSQRPHITLHTTILLQPASPKRMASRTSKQQSTNARECQGVLLQPGGVHVLFTA